MESKKRTENNRIVIKYNNDLNLLTFPRLHLNQKKMVQLILGMTRKETDEKFQKRNVLSKYFNEKTRTIEIKFMDFYKLLKGSEWKLSINEVKKMVSDMLEKIMYSQLTYEDDDKIIKYICFERIDYNKETDNVKIRLGQEFYEMIIAYENGYTIVDYFEFSSLNSIYSQNLYPLLRQFRTTGKMNIFEEKWEQFASIMQFPTALKMKDIDKILNQVQKELSSERTLFDSKKIPFKNLKYEKIKGEGRGRGGKVIGIVWSFTPQKETKNILENPTPKQENTQQIQNKDTKQTQIIESTSKDIKQDKAIDMLDAMIQNMKSKTNLNENITTQQNKSARANIVQEWNQILKRHIGAYIDNNGDCLKIINAYTKDTGVDFNIFIEFQNPDTGKRISFPADGYKPMKTLESFLNWFEKNQA